MLPSVNVFGLLLFSILHVPEVVSDSIVFSNPSLDRFSQSSPSGVYSFPSAAQYPTSAGSTISQSDLRNTFPESNLKSTTTIANTPGKTNTVSTSIFQPLGASTTSTTGSSSSSATSTSSSTGSASASSSSASSSFSKALLTIPAFQNFLNVPIPVSEASRIFFNNSFKILSEFGHENANDVANLVSQSVASLDSLTLTFFSQKLESALEKFLISEGIEILPTFPQRYASSIESAVKSANVNDIESLYQAITYGFVNFINSLGLNFVEKADSIAQIFYAEHTSR